MKILKNILLILLAVVLVTGLCACDGGSQPSGLSGNDNNNDDDVTYTPYAFCDIYAGAWTDSNYEFIAFQSYEGCGYFMWGEWNAGFGRGFGEVTEVKSKGDNIYELSVYYPAMEESEEYAAANEETIVFNVDVSNSDYSSLLCDAYSADYIEYKYLSDYQLSENVLTDGEMLYYGSPWADDNGIGELTFNMDGTGYAVTGNSAGIPGGNFTWSCESGLTIDASNGETHWFEYVFANNCIILGDYYSGFVFYPGNDSLEGMLGSPEYDFLIGKWYNEGDGTHYEFNADGTFRYWFDADTSSKYSGRWNAAGNDLYTDNGSGWWWTYIDINQSADTMSMTGDGYEAVFVRVE